MSGYYTLPPDQEVLLVVILYNYYPFEKNITFIWKTCLDTYYFKVARKELVSTFGRNNCYQLKVV